MTLRYDDRLETIMNARTRDAGARAAMWSQLVDVLAQDRGNFPPELRNSAYRWLEKWRSEVPEKRRVAASHSVSSRPLPAALVDFFAKDVASVAAPVLSQRPVPVRNEASSSEWIAYLPGWPPASRALLADRGDLPDDLRRALGSLGPQGLALPAAEAGELEPQASTQQFPPLAEEPTIIPSSRLLVEQADSSPAMQQASVDDVLDLSLDAVVADPVTVAVATPVSAVQPGPVANVTSHSNKTDKGVRPIGALLERIERYRKDNPAGTASRNADKASEVFVFEADRSGLLNWVDGAPRGALIGLSIAEMALPGEAGVDGQAAGAFRKRAPFDHARLHVTGHGPASGEWLMSGVPLFEGESGRFLGYQGQARRMASPVQESSGELLGGSLRPASVRQLVHELRTPLNAIRGFAEMIEGEFLGPVADPYRQRATAIVQDSASLLRVFEDLENAARLESGDYMISPNALTDLNALTRDVIASAASMTESHSLNLRVQLPDAFVKAAVDEVSARRLVDGFIELLIGISAEQEVIDIGLVPRDGFALLEAHPAAAMRGKWDWSATISDDGGLQSNLLPLGIGYKLRLLARMADRVGGSLHASGDRLSLLLPLTSATEEQIKNG